MNERVRHDVGAVVREHTALVERVLLRSGVAERDLPDARQEVFLVVLRKLAGFEHRSLLTTWLYRIAIRVASQYRRRAYHRREALAAEPAEELASDDTLAALELRDDFALALAALQRMDEAKREVLVLYELEELPMAEVAARLRCPLKTAFSRLYAARREVLVELRRNGVLAFVPAFLPLRASLRASRAVSWLARRPGLSWPSLGLVVACTLLPAPSSLRVAPPAAARAPRQTFVASAGAAPEERELPPRSAVPASRGPTYALAKPSAARKRLSRAREIAPAAAPLPSEPRVELEPEAELSVFRAGERDLRPAIENPLARAEQPKSPRAKIVLRDPIDPASKLESELGARGL